MTLQSAKDQMRGTQQVHRPQRIFLLIAPFIFALYALLVPPFHTFDETQHLQRAWQVSELGLTAERRGTQSGGMLPPGLAKAAVDQLGEIEPQGVRHVVVHPLSSIFSRNTPPGYDQPPVFYNFFGAAIYSPVSYLPQALAVRIGHAAGLSVEWIVRLGRLFNAAISIALIAWALALMPFGRRVMLTIALLPPVAAGTASLGLDGLVIGCGFLATAWSLKAAVTQRWSMLGVTAFGLATITATLAKFVYLPLVAVAALPRPRGVSWHRWLAVPLMMGFVAAIAFLGWMSINAHAIVKFRPELPTMVEQVSWIIANPAHFALLIAQTYWNLAPYLWAGFYAFGDSTVPVILPAAIAGAEAILLAMIWGDRADDLTRGRRLWMLFIFASVAILVATALFIGGTPQSAHHIGGIQSRYLTPVLPLAAMAAMRRSSNTPRLVLPAILALSSIAHVATLGTMLRTFYSF